MVSDRHLLYRKSAYLAEVSVTEHILRKISKFPEILGELSMHKQCVPGSFFSAHALEPGNEARHHACLMKVWEDSCGKYFDIIVNMA